MKEADLLEVIAYHPTLDLARLDYAAWAEGLLDPRSLFIYLQMEATAILREQRPPAELVSFEQDMLALEHRHGREWAGEIADHVAAYRFGRGFVESVQIDARSFLRRPLELVMMAPLAEIGFTGVEHCMEELLACPILRQLVSLRFDGQPIGDAGARAIAASEHLRYLAKLSIDDCQIGPDGIEALASTERLPNLRFVRCGDHNPFEDPVDRPVIRDGRVVDYVPTAFGQALEAAHGPLQWLHWRPEWPRYWPPDWRCFTPEQ